MKQDNKIGAVTLKCELLIGKNGDVKAVALLPATSGARRASKRQGNRRAAMGVCDECGQKVATIMGCPDGAEICQRCFDAGYH